MLHVVLVIDAIDAQKGSKELFAFTYCTNYRILAHKGR